MYSRITGTLRANESSGSQIRAARRAPSASSIHWFSISRTARGNWSRVFTGGSPKGGASGQAPVMGERLHRPGDGAEARHGRAAVVAGAHIAVGQRRLATQGGGNAGLLQGAVIDEAIVMQGIVGRHGDEC